MKFDPDRHRRRSIRLSGYDYTQPGMYFVTICTYQRTCILGAVQDDSIVLSSSGQVVDECWRNLPQHFPSIELGTFVIMPNHLHGIIVLRDRVHNTNKAVIQKPLHSSPRLRRSPNGTQPNSVGAIVQNFKSVSTRKVNQMLQNCGATVWQRNYYEHIVRDETALNNIRRYIEANPAQWADDEEHPNQASRNPI